jgi:NAD(P)-dependent dehydrogenase (short-subunit alcohol dehydrogenase family)
MSGTSISYPFNLQETEGIATLVKNMLAEIGPIDGFVHCAGVKTTASLRVITPALAHKNMNINFYAFLELTKLFTTKNAFRPGMSIVGVSSTAAHQGTRGHTLYSASKAALEAASRCLAHELAPKNIRVNTVVPSLIDTSFSSDVRKFAETSYNVKSHVGRQYLGIGEASDVASLIVFLLSQASRFITGSSFPVDGGRLSS